MSEEKKIDESSKPQTTSDKQETNQQVQPATGNRKPEESYKLQAASGKQENSQQDQPQTKNLKTETENMEVHKHPHHVTHKKKWEEYLLEFLMLFLAVFLGFMAENFREHQIEHKRAEQFAKSLFSDLQSDTSTLATSIAVGNRRIKAADSLIAQIEQAKENWVDTLVYRYTGITGRHHPFKHNSGTYEQMKASGSLRYFDQNLVNLLNKYAVQAEKTAVREEIILNYGSNMFNPFILQVLDVRPLIQLQDGRPITHSLVFRKSDKETVNLWINYASVVQSTQERTVVEYDAMLNQAKQIMAALKKEYHLE
jgi:hypothetical protein